MRIDKFLKISRLVKRRTVAKEMADQGRVSVNGKTGQVQLQRGWSAMYRRRLRNQGN